MQIQVADVVSTSDAALRHAGVVTVAIQLWLGEFKFQTFNTLHCLYEGTALLTQYSDIDAVCY